MVQKENVGKRASDGVGQDVKDIELVPVAQNRSVRSCIIKPYLDRSPVVVLSYDDYAKIPNIEKV